MTDHIIIGVHVKNRTQQAIELQKVFTEYGCSIKTRLGLHDTDENSCSIAGIILLEIFAKDDLIPNEMLKKFNAIDNVEAQIMRFTH
ncbi:MAG: hypothetical protein D6B27_03305 [Gammaproteobacteria bacterium]|nr:MAG: hypothetical protein D6B27_03305 [Gammaproteobacteria bacterium]